MSEYYLDSTDLGVLNERVAELSRIRQDFATHLGSSLYEVTKDDDRLRWGRESLYNGIADCDKEREAILKRIADLEPAPVSEVEEEEQTVSMLDLESDATIVMSVQPEPEVTAEPVTEVETESEPMTEPEPMVDPEPTMVMPSVSVSEPEPEPEPEPEATFVPKPEPEPELSFTQQLEPIPAPEPVTVPSFVPQPTQVNAPTGIACPNCGAIASVGDKFCMECGTALNTGEEPTPAYAQPTPSICPACGNPVDPSFKFCMTCGHKLV